MFMVYVSPGLARKKFSVVWKKYLQMRYYLKERHNAEIDNGR